MNVVHWIGKAQCHVGAEAVKGYTACKELTVATSPCLCLGKCLCLGPRLESGAKVSGLVAASAAQDCAMMIVIDGSSHVR